MPFDPTWLTALLVLVPAVLAKLGIHIPNITPTPIPQVPTVDKPLSDCLALLDQYAAKTAVPDPADTAALAAIAGKIAALSASLK